MKKPTLSIIVLNHNTKDITLDCLESIEKVRNELEFEVIVSDNASTDGSVLAIKNKYNWVKIIEGPNISFSNGNNRAKNIVQGKYILLLNSDTLVYKGTLKKCVEYFENNKDVGALTCKLVLPDGTLDKDVRRRFPTPSIFLDAFLFKNKDKYWYADIPDTVTHEVEAIQGAFFLTTKKILDQVGWLDEKFIFDGEDLDLSFQVKKAGYKIIYYPEVSITHIKKATRNKLTEIKIKRKMQGVDSLIRFYRKNMWQKYPFIINYMVIIGLSFLKLARFLITKFLR